MSSNVPAGRTRESGLTVDAARLWPGGIATAVVAGMIALVGVLVSRWLFTIPLLAPRSDGAYGDAHTTGLVLAAGAAALVATALMHLLLISTPRPFAFFSWILVLATALAVLYPFSTAAPISAKIATALVDLVLGIAIGSLITSVAGRSLRSAGPVRRAPASPGLVQPRNAVPPDNVGPRDDTVPTQGVPGDEYQPGVPPDWRSNSSTSR
jgi:hypothetical protein